MLRFFRYSYSASVLLLGLWLLSACSKNNGENQGLSDAFKEPFDLMSAKEGTWWLYKADDGAVFYRYATGKDTVKEGLTFEYYYRIDTTSVMREHIPEYFGKNSGRYISLIDVDGKETNYITYILLKEGWYNGMKWENTENKKIDGWNLNMKIESEVVNVSETITLEGVTYENVVHVFNDLKAKSVLMPAFVDCGNLDVWYKPGIGILKQTGSIKLSLIGISVVDKNYNDYMLDYHIEP